MIDSVMMICCVMWFAPSKPVSIAADASCFGSDKATRLIVPPRGCLCDNRRYDVGIPRRGATGASSLHAFADTYLQHMIERNCARGHSGKTLARIQGKRSDEFRENPMRF